jgi:hypothetical protein
MYVSHNEYLVLRGAAIGSNSLILAAKSNIGNQLINLNGIRSIAKKAKL